MTVATFVKAAVTPDCEQLYDVLWPAVNVPIALAQPVESGSVTVTFVSVTVLEFVTVIVKLAVPPEAIACVAGVFVIAIAGLSTTRCSEFSELHGLFAALLLESPL